MKIYLLLISILFIPYLLNAQNNLSESYSAESGKKGLVFIGLINNDTLGNQFNERVTVSKNYFDVEILNNVVHPLDKNNLKKELSQKFTEQEINTLLNNSKIGQQIISYWLDRQPNGTFNLKILGDKQILSDQDIALILESDSKKLSKESITTLNILNQNYVVLVDFKNIQTMKDYYDENDTEKEYRILNGFFLNFDYYLVKLDFNTSVNSYFFRHFWFTKDTPEDLTKKQNFDTAAFPFVLIESGSSQVASTQYKQTGNTAGDNQDLNTKLLGDLVNLANNKAISNIENDSTFLRFNRIQKLNPVSSLIGTKEDLKFDRRYSVFENQMTGNGNIKYKKVGTLKSMKIDENNAESENSNDTYSEFYQIGGKKLTTSGMYVEKRREDLGINICYDKTVSGPLNTAGRFEYYFSRLFEGTIQNGKRAEGLTSLKFYFEVGFSNGTYMMEESSDKFKFVRGTIGLIKDFYPVRFLNWSPFIGYGMESSTWEGSDNLISTNLVEAGLRIGLNLTQNLQLMGTLKKNIRLKTVLLDGEREVIDENYNYSELFFDRNGSSFSLGLRIML